MHNLQVAAFTHRVAFILLLTAGPVVAKESTDATRMEHDLLGDKAVPATAYYGVQTARAIETARSPAARCRTIPN